MHFRNYSKWPDNQDSGRERNKVNDVVALAPPTPGKESFNIKGKVAEGMGFEPTIAVLQL
jgi:hypothetical protein